MPVALPVEKPLRIVPRPRRSPQTLGVVAVIALIGTTVAAIQFGRSQGVGLTALPPAHAVARLAFRAEDQPDGAIDLRAAEDGRLVGRVAPGEGGFVRGTLRGLAQARQREGFGPEAPFTLTGFDNGTLALEDGATGRRVALEAFGAINAEAFARLLSAGTTR
ncbi:photosynthetic complex assembly protein PuhC [Methylobacterium sp. Leaf118]|uniref:photosynthetic complex assembly protein PuhC n=1 Tax=Methylobacterium sp. Leaf118 TaxID=2876562 RepID=UPI001E4E92FF|nr:photosynthetic complex assembly protein PuhC [Methylobacterium sp. Leaf118]